MENENKGGGFGTEEQQYGQQNYGGQTYGQPNYGMGAVPVDADGQPLKNRFGMKITFSILEILWCCACNPVTMLMGIIGCVFTAQANNSYKAGKWDEFRSQARTASICLWVGFGMIVLYLVIGILSWTVGGGHEEFENAFWDAYYSELDSYMDDSDYYDSSDDLATAPEADAGNLADANANAAALDVIAGEGFVDPSITIEGVMVSLPLSYLELEALGFYIDDEDKAYVINQEEYYNSDVYDMNGEEIGTVYIGNETEEPLTLAEGTVFGFWFTSDDLEDGVSISFANGITEQSGSADFMQAYGEPDYEYESDDSAYQSYQWYNHNDEYYDIDENSLSVDFWEGRLDELDIMYIGWD